MVCLISTGCVTHYGKKTEFDSLKLAKLLGFFHNCLKEVMSLTDVNRAGIVIKCAILLLSIILVLTLKVLNF